MTPTDQDCEVLRRIEAVSKSLEMRGRWLVDDLNKLVNLPDWETKAEDALEKAEMQMRRTLQTVQQARALMLKKRPLIAAE